MYVLSELYIVWAGGVAVEFVSNAVRLEPEIFIVPLFISVPLVVKETPESIFNVPPLAIVIEELLLKFRL